MLNNEKRKDIESKLREVDDLGRIEYERRLSVPYNNGTQSFMDQYLKGGGSELEKKFWSRISSSRLCFELYSWIVNTPQCIGFAFEYKLPRLGTLGTPNMDVYIETNNEIWYIESKFTENVNNQTFGNDLPEQYWKEVDEQGNSRSGGGFHTTQGKYREKSLIDRFGRNEKLQLAFQRFCEETDRQAQSTDPEDWFDAKQETCHILGIIIKILNSSRNQGIDYVQKKINFANIVYSFDEPITAFTKDFIDRAKSLVMEITNVEINYEIISMQDVISKYGERKAYEANGLTVYEQINKYFGPIF